MIKVGYLSCLVIVLGGCSFFSPTYTKPNVDVPNKWLSSDKNMQMNESMNLPELAWWNQFNDPELNLLIKDALSNNNDVNIAMANLEYAKGQLKQVKLSWVPSMPLLSGYSQMPNLGDPGYFWGLFPSYTLNIFQQIKLQEQAKYMVEASGYARDGARLTLIGQVAAGYFTLLAEQEALGLYTKLLDDMKEEKRLYQSKYNSGLISLSDIEDVNSQIKQVEAQLAVIQHNITVSKNALHYLNNQNPGEILFATNFAQIKSDSVVIGDLPATVLNNRPDIHLAEAQLKAGNADLGVVASNLLPSIKLDSFVGSSSANNGAPLYLNEAYISAPLLNAQAYGQIDRSKAQYKALTLNYIDVVRAALRDVDNDLSAHTAYTLQLSNNTSADISLRHACALEQSRYNAGISDALAVTECQIKLDNFALVLNQNKLDKLMTIVALYQDLGGGYNGV